jgi:ABC-type glycerol-3-phosphate transport system permease component
MKNRFLEWLFTTIITMVLIPTFIYLVGVFLSLPACFIEWSFSPLYNAVTFEWFLSIFDTENIWKEIRVGILSLFITSSIISFLLGNTGTVEDWRSKYLEDE